MEATERNKRYYKRYNPKADSWSIVEHGHLNDFGNPYIIVTLITEEEANRWLRTGSIVPQPKD